MRPGIFLRMRAASVAISFVAALLAGCAGGPRMVAVPPSVVAMAWADAVARNDPHGAYALLAAPIRKAVTYEDFARRWQQTQAERQSQARSLTAAASDGGLGETAQLTLADGKVVTLTHEANGWRVDNPLLSTTRAPEVQDALRLLAQAVDERSFDSTMRVLTSTRRDGLREVLDGFATGIRSHIGDEVEITADRARFSFSDRKRKWLIKLKREDGDWRIDDIELQP